MAEGIKYFWGFPLHCLISERECLYPLALAAIVHQLCTRQLNDEIKPSLIMTDAIKPSLPDRQHILSLAENWQLRRTWQIIG